jgi:hypothetical protein
MPIFGNTIGRLLGSNKPSSAPAIVKQSESKVSSFAPSDNSYTLVPPVDRSSSSSTDTQGSSVDDNSFGMKEVSNEPVSTPDSVATIPAPIPAPTPFVAAPVPVDATIPAPAATPVSVDATPTAPAATPVSVDATPTPVASTATPAPEEPGVMHGPMTFRESQNKKMEEHERNVAMAKKYKAQNQALFEYKRVQDEEKQKVAQREYEQQIKTNETQLHQSRNKAEEIEKRKRRIANNATIEELRSKRKQGLISKPEGERESITGEYHIFEENEPSIFDLPTSPDAALKDKQVERIDWIYRVATLFTPLNALASAVPIAGDILVLLGYFGNAIIKNMEVTLKSEILFNSINSMLVKIAEMELFYDPTNNFQGGAEVPEEFIKLREALENGYFKLLKIALTQERINALAKFVEDNAISYSGEWVYCDNIECPLRDRIKEFVLQKATNRATSLSSIVYRQLDRARKDLNRSSISIELLSQMNYMTSDITVKFVIALARYTNDIRNVLVERIESLEKEAEEKVNKLSEETHMDAIDNYIHKESEKVVDEVVPKTGGTRKYRKNNRLTKRKHKKSKPSKKHMPSKNHKKTHKR